VKVFRVETVLDTEYREIVTALNDGGVIAFPTDTAYGLGANPFDRAAVNRIFEVKGRPENKPLLLLVDSLEMADSIIEPSQIFEHVANAFWPGPITLITRARPVLPGVVTAGTQTVGLRQPVAAFAIKLLSRFRKPITATCANRTGLPAAITAEEVRVQIGDRIDILIDGGELPTRGGSTLLDLTADPPIVVREGPVTFETLSQFFKGNVRKQVA
jgi:L-threonylcarbamoyladenylate synthase